MKHRLGFDLILLGDPASGKDTQALLLSKKYNVRLARSGEYLRKYYAKHYIQGGVAPTKLILPFLRDSLKDIFGKNVIFVGAARLEREAKFLVRLLTKAGRDFFVLYIQLAKPEVIKRSKLRAARPEDTSVELINKRLQYFKTEVKKTVQYYKKLRKIKFIKGENSVNNIHKEIISKLNDYKKRQTT
jgi:adenylate kinase family enzyme